MLHSCTYMATVGVKWLKPWRHALAPNEFRLAGSPPWCPWDWCPHLVAVLPGIVCPLFLNCAHLVKSAILHCTVTPRSASRDLQTPAILESSNDNISVTGALIDFVFDCMGKDLTATRRYARWPDPRSKSRSRKCEIVKMADFKVYLLRQCMQSKNKRWIVILKTIS